MSGEEQEVGSAGLRRALSGKAIRLGGDVIRFAFKNSPYLQCEEWIEGSIKCCRDSTVNIL